MIGVENVVKSFEIIPSDKANEILLKNMDNSGEKNFLYVFAGPNGSRKSTLIANFYKLGIFKNVKYINADIYAKTIFKDVKNEKERNYQAMFYTMENIKNNIKSKNSVIYETVMSHPSKLDLIKKYKENGYKIFSIFISPNKPSINIKRVAKRVEEGGHNVAQEKITQRFFRSNALKEDLMKLSDVYYEIDNTNLPKIAKFNLKYRGLNTLENQNVR